VTVALGGIGNSLRSGQPIQKVDRFLFVLLVQMSISERHGHGLVAQDLLYLKAACRERGAMIRAFAAKQSVSQAEAVRLATEKRQPSEPTIGICVTIRPRNYMPSLAE